MFQLIELNLKEMLVSFNWKKLFNHLFRTECQQLMQQLLTKREILQLTQESCYRIETCFYLSQNTSVSMDCGNFNKHHVW